MQNNDMVAVLKALSDQTRLQIFDLLRNGTLCACKILENLNITQPTLSHHMKVLCDCGLVDATKDWKWTHYSINCQTLNQLLAFLGDTKCRRQ